MEKSTTDRIRFQQIEKMIADVLIQLKSSGTTNFAVYRLPNENTIHIVAGNKCTAVYDINELNHKEGFVITDFSGNSHLLTADYRWDSIHNTISPPLNSADSNTNSKLPFHYRPSTAPSDESIDQNQYIELVEKAVHHIQAGKSFKIVPGRMQSFDKNINTKEIKIFDALCNTYPNAFISLIST